jgi:acyl-coenzyme A thioesterase PaaI-like protein
MATREMPRPEQIVGVPPEQATAALYDATPLARTLGIEVLHCTPQEVELVLPDLPSTHNHVGGPHAGAIFTVGETAAGLLAAARFGDWMDTKVGLAVRADIEWVKLARTAVRARAHLAGDPDAVDEALRAGQRPEWATEVTFTRGGDDAVCGTMRVTLTLVDRRD